MNIDDFKTMKDNLKEYQYTSMMYTDWEEVLDYKVLCNNKDLILLCKPDIKSEATKFLWAANEAKVLLKDLHGAKRSFLAADECNLYAIKLYESMGFVGNKEEAERNMIRV